MQISPYRHCPDKVHAQRCYKITRYISQVMNYYAYQLQTFTLLTINSEIWHPPTLSPEIKQKLLSAYECTLKIIPKESKFNAIFF